MIRRLDSIERPINYSVCAGPDKRRADGWARAMAHFRRAIVVTRVIVYCYGRATPEEEEAGGIFV